MPFSARLLICLALGACAAEPAPPARTADRAASKAPPQGPGGTRYVGGDGYSCESPVRIEGASSSAMGLKAQGNWIREHYPRSRKLARDSLRCDDRPVERITIMAETGEQVELFFDISDYMDKS